MALPSLERNGLRFAGAVKGPGAGILGPTNLTWASPSSLRTQRLTSARAPSPAGMRARAGRVLPELAALLPSRPRGRARRRPPNDRHRSSRLAGWVGARIA